MFDDNNVRLLTGTVKTVLSWHARRAKMESLTRKIISGTVNHVYALHITILHRWSKWITACDVVYVAQWAPSAADAHMVFLTTSQTGIRVISHKELPFHIGRSIMLRSVVLIGQPIVC